MTTLLGLRPGSPWSRVIRCPPTATILSYLVDKWQEYAAHYGGIGEPLARRDEPELTEGLSAFLGKEFDGGRQPFDGEFFCELKRFDLLPDGKRICIGRTDIEWKLFGFPNFIVEFKIIGGGRRAIKYVTEGMARFVDGRYGPRALEGAMWAFIRPSSPEQAVHVQAHVDAHSGPLRCIAVGGAYRISPSELAPSVATFDSLHDRDPPAPTIRLAHVFIDLPV